MDFFRGILLLYLCFWTHKQFPCIIRAASFLSVSITGHVTKCSIANKLFLGSAYVCNQFGKNHAHSLLHLLIRLTAVDISNSICTEQEHESCCLLRRLWNWSGKHSVKCITVALSVEREELSILILEFWRKNCKLCSIQNKIIRVSFYINLILKCFLTSTVKAHHHIRAQVLPPLVS